MRCRRTLLWGRGVQVIGVPRSADYIFLGRVWPVGCWICVRMVYVLDVLDVLDADTSAWDVGGSRPVRPLLIVTILICWYTSQVPVPGRVPHVPRFAHCTHTLTLTHTKSKKPALTARARAL